MAMATCPSGPQAAAGNAGVSREAVTTNRIRPMVSDALEKRYAHRERSMPQAQVVLKTGRGASRLRQMIIGRATKQFLAAAELPVFLVD